MTHIIQQLKRPYKVYILIADLFLIFLSYVIAFLVRYKELPAFNFTPFINASPYILCAAVIYLDMYKVLSFYRKSIYDVLKSIALLVALLGITTIAVTYMLQGFSFPRLILIVTPIIQFILLGSFNLVLLYWSRFMLGERTVMIVCSGPGSNGIVEKVDHFLKGVKVEKKLVLDLSQEKIIMRRLKDVDEVYLSANIPAEFKAEILKRCMGGNQVIYIVPHLFEISLINAKVIQMDDTPAFMIDKLGLTAEQAFVKRAFDVVLTLLGIIVLSPLLLLVTLLIKVTSKGPAFYKQERMTKNNKSFTLIKFRTMKLDAEELTGPILSEENDPRVTRIGRILRKTRIDELPQLLNVLKGDMSLVGPRPERPFFVEQFIHDLPEYEHRFTVKAGITGYAQIHGNYGTSPENKLRYDLMYMRNYSLLLDIKLIIQTLGVFFTPGSAKISTYPEVIRKEQIKHPQAKNQVV